MSFSNEIKRFSWDEIEDAIFDASPQDVEWALGTTKILFKDLIALLSPAAEHYLERMAQISHRITVQRFGRVIQMYAPLYVSSECTNSCVYCGFNRHNSIERDTLTIHKVISEAKTLHNQGFRHLLLVSGEAPRHVPLEYLIEISKRLRSTFSSLSIEVYPMDVKSYCALVAAGVDGLTIYQETYHPEAVWRGASSRAEKRLQLASGHPGPGGSGRIPAVKYWCSFGLIKLEGGIGLSSAARGLPRSALLEEPRLGIISSLKAGSGGL